MAFNLGSLLLNAGEVAGNAIQYQKKYALEDAQTADVRAQTLERQDDHQIKQAQLAQMSQQMATQKAIAAATGSYFQQHAGQAQGFQQQQELNKVQTLAALSAGDYVAADGLMKIGDQLRKDADEHNKAGREAANAANENLGSLIEGAKAAGSTNDPDFKRQVIAQAAAAGKPLNLDRIKTPEDWQKALTGLETGTKVWKTAIQNKNEADRLKMEADDKKETRRLEAQRLKDSQERTAIMREKLSAGGQATGIAESKVINTKIEKADQSLRIVKQNLELMSGTTSPVFDSLRAGDVHNALIVAGANLVTPDSQQIYAKMNGELGLMLAQLNTASTGRSNQAVTDSFQKLATAHPGDTEATQLYVLSNLVGMVKMELDDTAESRSPHMFERQKAVRAGLDDLATLIPAPDVILKTLSPNAGKTVKARYEKLYGPALEKAKREMDSDKVASNVEGGGGAVARTADQTSAASKVAKILSFEE